MEELGQYLKSLREQQGLSLEDVASTTKIHIHKLSAIEDGDKAALPTKVFAIGLIKSYGRALKADSDKLSQLCDAAYQVTTPVAAPTPEPPPAPVTTEEDPTITETSKVGLFQFPLFVGFGASIVVIALLVTMIAFVINKMDSYSSEQQSTHIVTENTSISGPVSEPPPSEPDKKEKKEEDEPPQEVEKTQEVVAQKIEVKTPVKVSKNIEPAPATDPLAEPTTNDENSLPPDTSDQPNADVAVVRSDSKLVVKALEPVRLELIWEDGFVQVMLLKSQESRTLVFSTPIRMRVNNGGAIQVSLNGKEPSVPGLFNQPIELTYP